MREKVDDLKSNDLKSIDELRGIICDVNEAELSANIQQPVGAEGGARVSPAWVDAWRRAAFNALDSIKQELNDRYIELPVDADGVPIRVDDTIFEDYGEGERYRSKVTALIYTNRWDFEFDDEPGDTRDVGDLSSFYHCARHAEPLTVEDVLRDAGVSVAAVSDVAAEIRELLEVGE